MKKLSIILIVVLALGVAFFSCDVAPKTFTVTFNANGAYGTVPNTIIAQEGSKITLPSGSGLNKGDNNTFGGWNTNPSGTGTNYYAGSSYTVTSDVIFYAMWYIENYSVSFNINEGTGGVPTTQNVSSGTVITLPGGSLFSKTGYNFTGWNTKADGTGTNYDAGSSYTVTGNITLFANWVLKPADQQGFNLTPGIYKLGGGDYFTFNSDGTCSYTAGSNHNLGTYRISYNYPNNNTVIITWLSTGRTTTLSITGPGMVTDPGGFTYFRQ